MREGLRTAALYAFGCQRTKELNIDEILKKFVIFGKNEKEIEFYLKKLEPYFYYQLIAMANRIEEPFNERVVRAYWIGNRLLEKVKPELLKEMVGQVDSFYLRQANYLIIGGKAHHNFSVLSKIPVKNKKIVEVVNQCLISWGKVIEKFGTELTVLYQPLILQNRKFILKDPLIKKVKCDLIERVKINDIVSIHFNEAREILSESDLEYLQKYTKEAIEMFN